MHAQVESLAQLTNTSLTDVILALCASGHFGVREAIAAATRQERRRLGSRLIRRCDEQHVSTYAEHEWYLVIPGKRMKSARPGIQ